MAIKAVEVVYKLKDLFSAQVSKVVNSFKKTEGASKRSADSITRSNQRAAKSFGIIGGGITSVIAKMTALASAAVGFVTFKKGAEGVLRTGAQFEKLAIQMEAVAGSAEKGQAAFAWVQDFAKKTPFQLEQLTEGYVKLKAFGIDPMDGSMQAIVDQSSKLGGSQETLNGIVLALGQAWAKQKLQGEEILQLVERGVPVWDLLSQATGKNTLELQKLSAAGKLGRTEISLLIAEIGKSADGAAAKQMDTLSGQVSNLKDAWTQFFAKIADSGVLDYVKDQLAGLQTKIQSMASSGELQELATKLSNGLINMAEGFKSVAKFIATYSSELKTAATVMVAMKMAAFAQTIFGVGKAFIAAARGIKIFKIALVSTGIGAVAVGLGELAGKAYEWVTAGDKVAATNKGQAKSYAELAKAEREAIRAKERAIQTDKDVAKATKNAYESGRKQADQAKATGGAYREQAQAIVDAAQAGKDATKTATDEQTKALKSYQNELEAAEQKLQAFKNDSKSVAKEFQDIVESMRDGPEKEAKDLTALDVGESINNAQNALNDGDYDGAIEGARETGEMLQKMKEAGSESDIVLTGLAMRLRNFATEAAAAKQQEGQTAVDQLQGKLGGAEGQTTKVVVQLDTAQAEQQLAAFTKKASAPISKPVYTSGDGKSFSDRPEMGMGDVRREALKRGKR